jgi:hypothetical protein
MKRVLIPLLACLLLGEANGEEAAYAGRGPQDMAQVCDGVPFYDRVDAYYPLHASNNNAPGRAVIDCAFDDSGYVSACEILSEDPTDRGFGGAALMMACAFSISTHHGRPVLRSRNLFPDTSTPVYAPNGQTRIRLAIRFAAPGDRHSAMTCRSPSRC